MTFRDLYHLFSSWNATNRAPRTAEFYRDQLGRLLSALGDVEADQLRPLHLLPYKATWHLIVAVQRLYRWALEHDLVQTNPVLRLKRPRLGGRRRVLSRRDLLRLLRQSAADYRRLLLAARETAARPLELRELDWTALQVPEGVALADALRRGLACFVLYDFKGRLRRADATATRTIPITPRLGRLLLRLLGGAVQEEPIFRTATRRPWSYSALRNRMRRLRRRSGLPMTIGGEKICQYTLRHSAATQWVADGMQLNVASELLGHAKVSTTQRYVHLNRAQLLEEWRRHQQRRQA